MPPVERGIEEWANVLIPMLTGERMSLIEPRRGNPTDPWSRLIRSS